MIVTTMAGMNAQPKVKVPRFWKITPCPPGATIPGAPAMPALTVPAIGTGGNGLVTPSRHESVDPTGTVSGLSGSTVVVNVDVPLTTRSGRPTVVAVATDERNGLGLTGRSQPSVSVTRTAASI